MTRNAQQRRQQTLEKSAGAALILVLGVLSVVGILAVQIMGTVDDLTRRQQGLKQLQQSYWYARAGEQYATFISRDYLYTKILKAEHTSLSFPIEQGILQVTLKPLQNCFNLNSFSQRSGIDVMNRAFVDVIDNPVISGDTALDATASTLDENLNSTALKRRQLQSLFAMLDLDKDSSDYFADRLIDWLDQDNLPSGYQGAENTYYASEQPGQLTPNQHLVISDEMRDFLGDKYNQYQPLLPYLCTRPGDNKLQININQLDQSNAFLISAALLDKIDKQTAIDIIRDRPEEGFASLADFWQLPAFKNIKISVMQKNSLSVENRYFQVRSSVSYKNASYISFSLIRINSKKQVQVISRQYGVNS
ncbi:MAG: hypothetical protein OFPI_02900 [Osedax symbiont Rs2]|nr:MAG: hypothetical protein OFPI_02900 [Osedax symbiont Rs2]